MCVYICVCAYLATYTHAKHAVSPRVVYILVLLVPSGPPPLVRLWVVFLASVVNSVLEWRCSSIMNCRKGRTSCTLKMRSADLGAYLLAKIQEAIKILGRQGLERFCLWSFSKITLTDILWHHLVKPLSSRSNIRFAEDANAKLHLFEKDLRI